MCFGKYSEIVHRAWCWVNLFLPGLLFARCTMGKGGNGNGGGGQGGGSGRGGSGTGSGHSGSRGG